MRIIKEILRFFVFSQKLALMGQLLFLNFLEPFLMIDCIQQPQLTFHVSQRLRKPQIFELFSSLQTSLKCSMCTINFSIIFPPYLLIQFYPLLEISIQAMMILIFSPGYINVVSFKKNLKNLNQASSVQIFQIN